MTFLDEFYYKWLDISFVEIGKAVKNATILNHLKWNLSKPSHNTPINFFLTCEPIPKLRSIEKKATAQNGECGIIVKPFGYTLSKILMSNIHIYD